MYIKLYEKLASMHGVSGREREVGKFIKEELSKHTDNIVVDGFGGVFGVFEGNGPKIMISGHMDEIGAMVVDITKDGFIKVIPVGGVNPEAFVSLNGYVTTKNKRIRGVFSSVPPHISKDNKISFDDLVFDVGADDYEAAVNMGIKKGCMITPIDYFYVTEDGKKMVSKAFDDRLGCAVCLEVAREMKNIKHPNTVILGATVQEEVGLRGAKVATPIFEPDLFITVDVSPASDYLGKPQNGKLGAGFLVRYYDPGCIMNPELLEYFEELAIKENIKFQYFRSGGGTDAGAAQYVKDGTLATTVGVLGRYIHSPATMVHMDDIEAAKNFVIKLIENFNEETLKKLKDIY